jgi:hypothetical protein
MPIPRKPRRMVVGRGIGELNSTVLLITCLFALLVYFDLVELRQKINCLNADLDHLARGRDGDEKQDYGYNFTNARRRSNSSTQNLGDFKTKFETVEPDPVFEEELHGPTLEEEEAEDVTDTTRSNKSSTSGGSEEESEAKKE